MKKEEIAKAERDIRFDHSIFVSIITSVTGLAYYAARFGFDDDSFLMVARVICASFFLILLPDIIGLIRLKLKYGEFWYNSKPFIQIIGLFLLVAFGILAPIVNLINFLAILGLVFSVLIVFIHLRNLSSKWSVLIVSGFAFVLSLWVIGVIWGRGVLNPLFFEKIVLGTVNGDSIYHSAVAGMIRTDWIPSTGLDGIPYLQYHWGSHYIFAQISKLFNINTVDFYNFAYPILFAPFVIRSFIYFVDTFRNSLKIHLYPSWIFYLLLIFAFAGIIPTDLTVKIGIYIFDIFTSESYSLSLAFAFILISLVLQVAQQLNFKKISPSTTIFFLTLFPFMLGLIGLLKISTFILLLISAGYFFIRLGLYRKLQFCLSAILCLTVTLIIVKYSYLGEETQYSPFYYLKYFVEADYRRFFPLTYFFWIWVYLAIRLKSLDAKTLNDIVNLLKKRKILDLESLLVVAFAGIIPGLIYAIPSAGAFFFSDFQRWLAIAFILASISLWWPRKFFTHDKKIFRLKISSIGFISIIIFLTYNSYKNIESAFAYRFVFGNISTRDQFMSKENEINELGSIKYLKYLIAEKHTPVKKAVVETASQPQSNLENNQKYQLIKLLKKQASLPDRNKTAIFIPQENYLFWNLVEYGSVQFIGPALAGLPLIGGIQPFAPTELSETERETLIIGLNGEQTRIFHTAYSKVNDERADLATVKYMLKKDLTDEEKIMIYDLFTSQYYNNDLKHRGYWSYDFPSETEYLEKFSSDEKICHQATEKNFWQVLIITTDQNFKVQNRTLDCKQINRKEIPD